MNHAPYYYLEVTEDTLDEIVGSEQIPAERRSRAVQMLKFLYDVAFFHLRVSSRQVRTELDKGVKNIRREVEQLSDALARHRWILEPLRLATFDKWLHEKSQSHNPAQSKDKLLHPPQIVCDLEESLEQLTTAFTYLEKMVHDYDRPKGSADLLKWITENGDGQGQFVRAELSTYFAKGGGINADTLILRNISELYRYLFEREFSINSAIGSVNYNRELGELQSEYPLKRPRELISDYSGPSLDFACNVLWSLQLEAAFLPQPSDDPLDHRKISLLGERSATDVELSNRIGDLWTADKKRRRNNSSKASEE
jgi:hypothetical protein